MAEQYLAHWESRWVSGIEVEVGYFSTMHNQEVTAAASAVYLASAISLDIASRFG